MSQTFKTTDLLRLEVERDTLPGELVNLVSNTNGELGGWGWITPIAGQALKRAGGTAFTAMEFRMGTSKAAYFTTEDLPVTPGKYVAGRWTNHPGAPSTQGYRVRFEFYDLSGVLISSGPQTAFRTTSGGGDLMIPAELVPAGAASTRLRCDFYKDVAEANPVSSSYMRFYRVVVVQADTAIDPATLAFNVASAYYTNVLSASHEISVERSELDAGVLRATVIDPAVDPSQSTLVRPGHKVRLRALTATDVWSDVASTKIVNGQATYDLARNDPAKRSRISLTSADAPASLGQKRAEGVATVAELPYVLEGCGVPWNCNGSGNQINTASVVAVNDQASAMDQVVLTRDSNLGYAWVDNSGVLQVWDRTAIGSTVAAVLDETVYNTGIVIDYDTDRCVNSVTVTFLRYDPSTGETQEVPYGPYRDEESIRVWGIHGAEFKIQWAIEDPAAIDALGASILAANATPQVRVNEVTIALDTAAKVAAHATRDLYDLVTVVNARAGINDSYRVTSIKHTITGEKWLLTLGFNVEGGVASPTYVPSPTGGANGLSFTQTIRPIGEVTMFYGALADVPAGWLVMDGSTFSGTTYPRLADHLGGTTLPNLSDRTPVGAGTKAFGSTGGSATHAHALSDAGQAQVYSTGATVGVRRIPTPGYTNNFVTTGTAGTAGGSATVGAALRGSTDQGDSYAPWLALWFIMRAV